MIFSTFLKLYVIAFVVFLAIDAVWLGLVATKFYQNEIGHLMADKPNYLAAIIFYVLFVIGLVYFIYSGVVDKNLGKTMLTAAIFGFMTYATYDLTNLATLQNWPLKVTIIDLVWGTFLSTAISTLTYVIYHALFS